MQSNRSSDLLRCRGVFVESSFGTAGTIALVFLLWCCVGCARMRPARGMRIVRHEKSIPVWSSGIAAKGTCEPSKETLSSSTFLLRNVLTKSECEEIVETSEKMGYTQDAPVSLGRDVRKNENCVWVMDDDFNRAIFERAKPLLPASLALFDETLQPCLGLNARWRLYKYNPTDVFKIHSDGAWTGAGLDAEGEYVDDIYHGTGLSWLTFLVYLNEDFEGGTTSFYTRDGRHNTLTVKPEQGSALCFFHGYHPLSPLHQGDLVTEGTKYVARTEVIYRHPPGLFA